MDILATKLHPEVGLKFNEAVILGLDNVSKFIQEHQEHFNNLHLESIEESQMLYGYDSFKNPVKIGYEDGLIQRIIILTQSVEYKRFKAVLSYDGHLYNGFQIQNNQPTIQGELTKVITNINGYDTLVQGCSRTDTGVHANHYVVHFDSQRDIDEEKWLELLNHQLPKDILVESVKQTHPIFHARYDVYKKRYIYKIKLNERNPFQVNYHWNKTGWNIEKLNDNLKQLIGTHDFTSFCKGTPDSAVRTIYIAKATIHDEELILEFEGNGFLRYMIRIIVYALYMISSGQMDIDITKILQEKSREHTKHLAPANGLYLDRVYY